VSIKNGVGLSLPNVLVAD